MEKLEIVKDCGTLSDEELTSRIANLITDYYIQFFGTDDITPRMIAKESSINTWHGCMKYIYKHFLSKIKLKHAPIGEDGKLKGGMMYDPIQIERIANIYSDFCVMYNKPPSAYAFSDLCGIDPETISTWKDADSSSNLTARHIRIYKKIVSARRESITNRVMDGGAATLGNVTAYNHEVLPQNETNPSDSVLSGDKLPRLTG